MNFFLCPSLTAYQLSVIDSPLKAEVRGNIRHIIKTLKLHFIHPADVKLYHM